MSMPPPLPPALPSSTDDQQHLRWLVIGHYAGGALNIALCGLFSWQLFHMQDFLSRPDLFPKGVPPPVVAMFRMARIFNAVVLAAGVCIGIATIISGWLIRERRARTFSLVVAALNGPSVPVGTAVCVFSFLVLLRESVRALYARPAEKAPPAG